MEIDTSRWEAVGETANCRYYLIEPQILAAVPRVGARDDGPSATENESFQNAYFRKTGRPGVTVVFVDRLVGQDKDARRVYQTLPDIKAHRGTALVGGSLLGRAIGSFFLGLSKPQVAIKMFADLDKALPWARQIVAAGAA
jgi:hypothetical protein